MERPSTRRSSTSRSRVDSCGPAGARLSRLLTPTRSRAANAPGAAAAWGAGAAAAPPGAALPQEVESLTFAGGQLRAGGRAAEPSPDADEVTGGERARGGSSMAGGRDDVPSGGVLPDEPGGPRVQGGQHLLVPAVHGEHHD